MKTSKPICTPRSCKRADHFEAGAVADVAEALVGVAAEGALQNFAVFGAVEKRAPLLEFADAVGSFLGVKLRHAPVVQEFSAAHRVAKMRAPIVGLIDVGHGGGEAAFGHYGVRFAEQRFANHADARALRQSFDRGAESRAARADDEDVVFVGFVFVERSQDSNVPNRAGSHQADVEDR